MTSPRDLTENGLPLIPPNLPPPFLPVPNVHNFRRLGSCVLPNGQRTRDDLVYRSAELSTITPEGIAALRKLGIRTIYDLRNAHEGKFAQRQADVEIPDVERIIIPVFPKRDSSPAQMAERMVATYGNPDGTVGYLEAYNELFEAGTEHGAFRRIFEHVLNQPDKPFLCHCTAGKDRTGMVCALLLSLAGVDDDTVAAEYALTEQGLSAWLERAIKLMLAGPLFNNDEALCRRVMGARKEYMAAFLGTLRDRYGGVEGYLKQELGFDDGEVQRIREQLLVTATQESNRL